MPKLSSVTPFYNPASVVQALYDTGLFSWPIIAIDLVSGRTDKNAPTPGRVMDWASGRRPPPEWVEYEAGRLLMRCWRNDPAGEAKSDGYARAFSAVYAAYLSLLAHDVAYPLLAPLDQAIGRMMQDRFGIVKYPGKAGKMRVFDERS